MLEDKIQQVEQKISKMLDEPPDILKADGYPDVQAFMATFRKMEGVVDSTTVTLPNRDSRLGKGNANKTARKRKSLRQAQAVTGPRQTGTQATKEVPKQRKIALTTALPVFRWRLHRTAARYVIPGCLILLL